MKLSHLGVLFAALIVTSCGSSSANPLAATTTASSPAPAVSSISVSGATPEVGQTAQFTATATLSDGTTQAITSEATWQSSNPSVITVSPSGMVTWVGFGEVDVTAGYNGVTGSEHLIVAAQLHARPGPR
jgi:hypothetical protein